MTRSDVIFWARVLWFAGCLFVSGFLVGRRHTDGDHVAIHSWGYTEHCDAQLSATIYGDPAVLVLEAGECSCVFQGDPREGRERIFTEWP